jgi:hypothetical protein
MGDVVLDEWGLIVQHAGSRVSWQITPSARGILAQPNPDKERQSLERKEVKEMTVKEIHNPTPTTMTVEGERMSPLATTTAAPARVIESCVPGRRVLRMINPFVTMILRSPLHRLLSSRLLLLTFTGHKTWKQYTIPVGYTLEGDTLTLFSSYSWYKNLCSARVSMHLRGQERTGLAKVVEEREAVLEAAEHLVGEYGLKEASARIGLALDISPPPTTEELAAALEGHVVIRIILD